MGANVLSTNQKSRVVIPIPLNKDVFFSADYGGKHLIRPTEYDISFWEWYKVFFCRHTWSTINKIKESYEKPNH